MIEETPEMREAYELAKLKHEQGGRRLSTDKYAARKYRYAKRHSQHSHSSTFKSNDDPPNDDPYYPRQGYCSMVPNPAYTTTFPNGFLRLVDFSDDLGPSSPVFVWGNMYSLPSTYEMHAFSIND